MINYYDINKEIIVEHHRYPDFCKKSLSNLSKKCKSFYQKISNNQESSNFYTCPYGFTCYKYKNMIYSTLIVNEYFEWKKVQVHLKAFNQRLSDFTVYNDETLKHIIENKHLISQKNEVFESTLHDLKNAISHFMDMTELVKEEIFYEERIKSNETLISAIEGYSLINYLIMYNDKRLSVLSDKHQTECNLHRMIFKLEKLLRFRARKKNVVIQILGNNHQQQKMYDDVYLGYYILLENAIKYSTPSTTIEINVSELDKNRSMLSIKNFTEYVEESDVPHLTELGYRSKLAQYKQGSGIGLSLAKSIFEDSKIDIEFSVTKTDESVTFTVTSITS